MMAFQKQNQLRQSEDVWCLALQISQELLAPSYITGFCWVLNNEDVEKQERNTTVHSGERKVLLPVGVCLQKSDVRLIFTPLEGLLHACLAPLSRGTLLEVNS